MTLKWWMLIPIFSFIALTGKCFYCKHKIPFYLWVGECLACALSYAILKVQFEVHAYYLVCLSLILLTLSLIDLRYYIVPHRLLFLLMITTLIFMPQAFQMTSAKFVLLSVLITIGITFQKWIGFGDIKLFIVLTCIMPLHFILYVIWFTFPIATLTYPLYYTFLKHKQIVPLVPSITLAFLVTAYYYPVLNQWFGGAL